MTLKSWRIRLRGSSKSVMVPMFWSYIAILMLAIVIGGVLYWKAKSVVERTVDHTNTAMLEQLREAVDSRLKEIEKLEHQITLHPKLHWLLNNDGKESDAEAYEIIQFTNELQRYQSLSNYILDFYIYVSKTDTFIGPNVKSSPGILFDGMYNFTGISSDQWRKDMQSIHFREYMPALPVNVGSGGMQSIITYKQSLPVADRSSLKGALLIFIDENKLRSLFQTLVDVNQGSVYIVDNHNQIISATSANADKLQLRYEQLAGQQGKLIVNRDEGTYVAAYTTSNTNGWKYVYTIPQDVFLDQVLSVKRWALLLLSLCVLGGITASLFLAYRNYAPLREVLRTIRQGNEAVTGPRGSEYELIRKTIESAQLTESHLRGLISQQTPIIRFNFLTRFIYGNVDPAELQPETLAFVGVQFVGPSYAVLLIEIEDMSGFTADGNEREWPLVSFIVSNIAGELANQEHLGFPVELEHKRVAVLLNLNEERLNDSAQDLQAISETLVQVLENRFHLKISIGISGVTDAAGMGAAFREALKGLDPSNRKRDNRTAAYDERVQSSFYYYFPLEVEQQLVNLVKAGDASKTSALIDSVYKENFVIHDIPPDFERVLITNLLGALLKIVQGQPETEQAIAAKLWDITHTYDSSERERLFSEMQELYGSVCQVYKQKRSGHSERLMDNIMRYIEQQYGENVLSVSSIAEHFGLTPQYLSGLFKKSTGQNLADYVVMIRIREAKRLMANPDYTIAQIAIMVGYANDIGFIRVFKKNEGVTPGAFRSSLPNDR
ncbi:AraC family transcriptional regulator [Paenibacillus sp. WQ 127069]|uniref:AraC family transcriptional regulator n=1 Tax=Paenibacillus baimaensis TaxID=2982185 RepID=A0ABT2UK87_9BACL|nr:AraC family transcriptional regulator [Paenibacillus sp. WQ 127069]MCU6795062.1 AraC family transcriptional regulator [Paenibacillus sp. WQ 127069]